MASTWLKKARTTYEKLTEWRPDSWVKGIGITPSGNIIQTTGSPDPAAGADAAAVKKIISQRQSLASILAETPGPDKRQDEEQIELMLTIRKNQLAVNNPLYNNYEIRFKRLLALLKLAAVWVPTAFILSAKASMLGLTSGMSALFMVALAAMATAYIIRNASLSHMIAVHELVAAARSQEASTNLSPGADFAKQEFGLRVKAAAKKAWKPIEEWMKDKANWLRLAVYAALPVAIAVVALTAPSVSLSGAVLKVSLALTAAVVFFAALSFMGTFNKSANISTFPANGYDDDGMREDNNFPVYLQPPAVVAVAFANLLSLAKAVGGLFSKNSALESQPTPASGPKTSEDFSAAPSLPQLSPYLDAEVKSGEEDRLLASPIASQSTQGVSK